MISQFNCHGDWAFYIEGDEVYHEDDLNKIKKELNWRAKIDLHTGLVKTLTWVDKNLNILKKEKPNYVHKK